MAVTDHIMKENLDLSPVEPLCPVPLGVSFAYVVVVDYRNLFPKVVANLQLVRNDGKRITLLP